MGRRGLIAAVAVVLAVVAAVVVVSMRSTNDSSGVFPTVSRKLVGHSTLLENKMAFKAMQMNTKYELKSAQKTILRGATGKIRHDAASAMMANIYAGIDDLKAGLTKNRRRLAEAASAPGPSIFHRKLPSVHVIKGAFEAMKGQIKTTLKVMKPLMFAVPASTHTGDLNDMFVTKHAAIKEMKHQIRGAIVIERNIVERDGDDNVTPAPKADAEIATEDATATVPSSISSTFFSAAANAHTPTAVAKAAMMASSGPTTTSSSKKSSSSSKKSGSSSKKSDK